MSVIYAAPVFGRGSADAVGRAQARPVAGGRHELRPRALRGRHIARCRAASDLRQWRVVPFIAVVTSVTRAASSACSANPSYRAAAARASHLGSRCPPRGPNAALPVTALIGQHARGSWLEPRDGIALRLAGHCYLVLLPRCIETTRWSLARHPDLSGRRPPERADRCCLRWLDACACRLNRRGRHT